MNKVEQIVERARTAKTAFGATCRKFSGAMTVQILKEALTEEGIPTSARDVFIRGIPVEADLVIPRQGQEPEMGLLYEPSQVAAVLEVKNTGLFGKSALEKLRQTGAHYRERCICFAYVTLEERRDYRYAPSTERLGFPCFTLAWHKTTGGPIEPTEDWDGLVNFLRLRMKT